MTTNAELACVCSAFILADDDIAITGEKIQTILKAANVDVGPYWPGLFARALEGVNLKELITRTESGAAAAPGKEENKKEEEPEESDDDMDLGLFD
nr:unnamed protein product [Callosobruchus chinensis]